MQTTKRVPIKKSEIFGIISRKLRQNPSYTLRPFRLREGLMVQTVGNKEDGFKPIFLKDGNDYFRLDTIIE